MNRLLLWCAVTLVTGCSSWPTANLLGDDYALAPFPVGAERSSLGIGGEGKGDAAPRQQRPSEAR